jgi:hypothetical protein
MDTPPTKAGSPGLLARLQPWQAFWGALLGFIGVCLTLVLSTQLTLDVETHRVRLEVAREERQRAEEASALRRGLWAEPSMNVAGLEAVAARAVTNFPTEVDVTANDLVFQASIPRLGILSQREVAQVYDAYNALHAYLTTISRASQWSRQFTTQDRTVVVASPAAFSIVREAALNAAKDIEVARDLLGAALQGQGLPSRS